MAALPTDPDAPIDWVVGYIHPSFARDAMCPDEGSGSSGAASRFHDNGELLWCIRSLRKYAPWLRRIHVILGRDGPPPDGLEPGSLIHLVRESAIGPIQPNSETKKMGYAKIPGLAERFIASDDDMFLGRPVEPGFFFAPDGRPRLGSVHMGWDGQGHVPTPWIRSDYAWAVAAMPRGTYFSYLTMRCKRENPWALMASYLRNAGLVTDGPSRPDLFISDRDVDRASQLLLAMVQSRPALICINDDWSEHEPTRRKQLGALARSLELLLSGA